MSARKTKVWLDCDPGHDDAIALLLALHSAGQIELVGVSTVGGNAPLSHTHVNAARLLALYDAPRDISFHRGLADPIRKPAIPPPTDIHGQTGLDGVVGLPPVEDEVVKYFYDASLAQPVAEGDPTTVFKAWCELLSSTIVSDDSKITFVITGPSTNVGAFRRKYPELYESGALEKCVVMGGSFDIPQWTPFAEFNVATDPDALQDILDSPNVPVVLVPLNITHQAIFKAEYHARLLDPSCQWAPGSSLPQAKSPLRESLSTMLTFFRQAYIDQFGFDAGPPLHDAVCVHYLTHPEDVRGRWAQVHVNIDLTSERNGETVAEYLHDNITEACETWEDRRRHSPMPNCFVTEQLNAPGFFEALLACVDRADHHISMTKR